MCTLRQYLKSSNIAQFLDRVSKALYNEGFAEHFLRSIRELNDFLFRVIVLAPFLRLGEDIYIYSLRLLESPVRTPYYEKINPKELEYVAEVFLEKNVDRKFIRRLFVYAYMFSKPSLVYRVASIVQVHGWPEALQIIQEALRWPFS